MDGEDRTQTPARRALTPSEEYTTRYSRIEREKDVFGRLIGVHKLKPSQEGRVIEYTPLLEGEVDMRVIDEDTGLEKTIKIGRRFNMMMAASVCEIDGISIPFSRTRGELDSIYDRLDKEGIEAAITAYVRLAPVRADDEEAGDTIGDAKK